MTIFPMFSISLLGINVHLTGDLSIKMMMRNDDDEDDDEYVDDYDDDADDDDIFNQCVWDQCPVDREFVIYIPR